VSTLQPIIPPDPPLSDGVVTLRTFRPEDVLPLHKNHVDAAVQAYMSIPRDQTLEATARWVTSRAQAMEDGIDASFAITRARSHEVIGSIGVDRSCDDPAIGSVGYWLFASARGRGLMTRALLLISPWAFKAMQLRRLQITVHEPNIASQRVAEKAGFKREGLMRYIAEQHGRRVDLLMYARCSYDRVPSGGFE
jgi:RimJ/RimL family protein N-acetyltransferase